MVTNMDYEDLAQFAPLVAKAVDAFAVDAHYAISIALAANRVIEKRDEMAHAREHRFVATD